MDNKIKINGKLVQKVNVKPVDINDDAVYCKKQNVKIQYFYDGLKYYQVKKLTGSYHNNEQIECLCNDCQQWKRLSYIYNNLFTRLYYCCFCSKQPQNRTTPSPMRGSSLYVLMVNKYGKKLRI